MHVITQVTKEALYYLHKQMVVIKESASKTGTNLRM